MQKAEREANIAGEESSGRNNVKRTTIVLIKKIPKQTIPHHPNRPNII